MLPALKQLYWRWRLRRESLPAEFDSSWYQLRYRDVAAAKLDPKIHYLRFGRQELRDPNPNFSASGYLRTAPDAAQADDQLTHYFLVGRKADVVILPEIQGRHSMS